MVSDKWHTFWSWTAFVLSVGGYGALMIGGYEHPEEINILSFGLWLVLSVLILYSMRSEGFSGWRMPLGWLLGNAIMLVMAFVIGGYTFNLGDREAIGLVGLVTTLAVWVTVGTATRRWNPRILYLGSVMADALAFYPVMKQYILPHAPMTAWGIVGWVMFFLGAVINAFIVERFVFKLLMHPVEYTGRFQEEKRMLRIVEGSLLSLENVVLILVVVVLILP